MASLKKHEVDNIFNIFSIILSRKTILGKTNLSNWLNNVFTKKGEDLLISKKGFSSWNNLGSDLFFSTLFRNGSVKSSEIIQYCVVDS